MANLTDDQIEQKAVEFRRITGWNDTVPLDAMTLIQKTQHVVPGMVHVILPDNQVDNALAQWDATAKRLIISESTFEQANRPNPDPRAVFTIAHEIAHAYLGHVGLLNRSFEKTKAETFSNIIKRQEREANKFAAALIAPLHLIKRGETAENIASRFGLSKQAAEIRRDSASAYYAKIDGVTRRRPAFIDDLLRELRETSKKPI